MLALIASLRGVDRTQIRGFVDKWISVVGEFDDKFFDRTYRRGFRTVT